MSQLGMTCKCFYSISFSDKIWRDGCEKLWDTKTLGLDKRYIFLLSRPLLFIFNNRSVIIGHDLITFWSLYQRVFTSNIAATEKFLSKHQDLIYQKVYMLHWKVIGVRVKCLRTSLDGVLLNNMLFTGSISGSCQINNYLFIAPLTIQNQFLEN